MKKSSKLRCLGRRSKRNKRRLMTRLIRLGPNVILLSALKLNHVKTTQKIVMPRKVKLLIIVWMKRWVPQHLRFQKTMMKSRMTH